MWEKSSTNLISRFKLSHDEYGNWRHRGEAHRPLQIWAHYTYIFYIADWGEILVCWALNFYSRVQRNYSNQVFL